LSPDPVQTTTRHAYVPPRRHHTIFNVFVAVSVTVLGYAGFTSNVAAPAFGDVSKYATKIVATLQQHGDDLIVTGSLGHLFEASTFTGPNRAGKRDRVRIVPDALSFAQSFDDVRARIAELRGEPIDPAMEQSGVPGLDPMIEEGPKMSVASIDPSILLSSPALSAIDDAAVGDPNAPLPLDASQTLAYARANAPVTDFSVVRDTNGKVVSDKELWCLASAVYFEARGESYRGQVAVAQVVMNRVKHKLYPDTICGVVYQNQSRRNACQFSFACDGRPERVTDDTSWAQAMEIAEGTVRGQLYLTEVGYATHYHATYVYPHWAPRMKKLTKIGHHVFYQFKRGWQFG
jgi:spore germination cell wall hydrolase CwlJ-like protein